MMMRETSADTAARFREMYRRRKGVPSAIRDMAPIEPRPYRRKGDETRARKRYAAIEPRDLLLASGYALLLAWLTPGGTILLHVQRARGLPRDVTRTVLTNLVKGKLLRETRRGRYEINKHGIAFLKRHVHPSVAYFIGLT